MIRTLNILGGAVALSERRTGTNLFSKTSERGSEV